MIEPKRIWVNGCFDILHEGHMELLKYAKSLGDTLIVGIDSDKRVKELKGPERPINSAEERKKALLELDFVNSVVIFKSEGELELYIDDLRIHCMVVGSDYKNKKVVGGQYAGSVKFFDKIEGYSTTKIIEQNGK